MQAVHDPVFLPDPAATDRLARAMASRLGPGDVLLLDGEIGAGKSHFARALIRVLTRPDEEVPSPTFTLVQTYDAPGFEIWHADLYRLSHPDEAHELGLLEAFETALCLVEWPERLGSDWPKAGLSLRFAPEGAGRSVSFLTTNAAWRDRLRDISDV